VHITTLSYVGFSVCNNNSRAVWRFGTACFPGGPILVSGLLPGISNRGGNKPQCKESNKPTGQQANKPKLKPKWKPQTKSANNDGSEANKSKCQDDGLWSAFGLTEQIAKVPRGGGGWCHQVGRRCQPSWDIQQATDNSQQTLDTRHQA